MLLLHKRHNSSLLIRGRVSFTNAGRDRCAREAEHPAIWRSQQVLSDLEAITDPAITPFPDVKNPAQFGLGRPVSPTMQAGDFLLFHASTVHSSPVKQSAPFRGSIDFRIAYPCLDDFSHYKWTFIQANNLINCEDEGEEINLSYQKLKF
mgnify:CR=1 FL=1